MIVRNNWLVSYFCQVAALATGAAMFSSCVGSRPYWADKPTERSTTSTAQLKPVPQENGYAWRPVEFDENGLLWNTAERREACEMVQRGSKSPLLVVFIHGWHNNAAPDNGNLASFKSLLQKLSATQNTYRVCGVYVGWRGESVSPSLCWTGVGFVPYLLSFYERRDATERIAGSNEIKDLLRRLATAARSKDGKCVFIGHSFGGRILERAVTQGIGSGDTIAYPSDLTILINPASEGIHARSAILAARLPEGQPPPVVVSLKSETDWATGWLWRTAKTLSELPHQDRFLPLKAGTAESERYYLTHTAGTIQSLQTHKIVPPDDDHASAAARLVSQAIQEGAFKTNLRQTVARDSAFMFVTESPSGKDRIKAWEFRVTRRGPNQIAEKGTDCRGYRSLYWIATVPHEILDGHNGDPTKGVFTDEMIDTVAALYKACKIPQKAAAPPTAELTR